jgi:hypothetical protein
MHSIVLNLSEKVLYRTLRPQRARILDKKKQQELRPFADKRSIFVHIPKTAGISVRSSLFGSSVGHHMSLRDYFLTYSYEEYAKYYKFTFVRNPWDRLFSAFRYLSGDQCTPMDRLWWSAQFGNISFTDFVNKQIKERGLPKYLHFAPQVSFLSPSRFPFLSSKALAVDFIGLYENLHLDFEHIARRLGVDVPLEHLNASRRGSHVCYLGA